MSKMNKINRIMIERMRLAVWLVVAVPFLVTSCIKDEAANKECDIESAWIEGDELAGNFYHMEDMKKEMISSTETNIIFTVRSMITLPTQIPVYFKTTPGATIQPANGSVHDFTGGPVTYMVTSEDGEWTRSYRVSFQEASLPAQRFSFENVETCSEKTMLGGENLQHEFYELVPKTESGKDAEERYYCWATGNSGAAMLKNGAQPEDFPTYSIADGFVGKGVCLTTQSAGSLGEFMKKPIAAGSLFLGRFIVESVLENPLKTTQFGVPNPKEPVRITGYYKYQPGESFTDMDMKVYDDRIDEASIYAVFYRNKDDEGHNYYLYGDDVETDEKLRANPMVYKVARVAALPPTNEWTRFEMFFEGKDAPDEIVSSMGFNLALVFSSSKRGAQFEGAVGSTLYVDEIEVSYEK